GTGTGTAAGGAAGAGSGPPPSARSAALVVVVVDGAWEVGVDGSSGPVGPGRAVVVLVVLGATVVGAPAGSRRVIVAVLPTSPSPGGISSTDPGVGSPSAVVVVGPPATSPTLSDAEATAGPTRRSTAGETASASDRSPTTHPLSTWRLSATVSHAARPRPTSQTTTAAAPPAPTCPYHRSSSAMPGDGGVVRWRPAAHRIQVPPAVASGAPHRARGLGVMLVLLAPGRSPPSRPGGPPPAGRTVQLAPGARRRRARPRWGPPRGRRRPPIRGKRRPPRWWGGPARRWPVRRSPS